MASRSWRWLRTRIVGLLSAPPAGIEPLSGTVIHATRLQASLAPPFSPRQEASS